MSNIHPLPKKEKETASEASEEVQKSQATILVEISQQAGLFTSQDEVGHAAIEVDGHKEYWPIRSKHFREWLSRQFWESRHKVPSSQAMADALNTIEANARYSGKRYHTSLRVAERDGKLYLDLCDTSWRCIEVSSGGWRVLEASPIVFIRHRHMEALPLPTKGDINELWRFINTPEKAKPLVVAWLLMALRHGLPYPILTLQGGHGAAKTTASRVLRRLVDASIKDTQSPPRTEDDLFVSLARSHITAVDNLSHIPDWLSDTLCRAATGAAISKRLLYSNDDEALIQVKRPIIINGIGDLAGRQDLISRQIIINLEDIHPSQRMKEEAFWQAFHEAHPKILGALLTLVANGLKQLPHTQLETLPRMADFGHWGAACLGEEFTKAYEDNIRQAVEEGLEASPLAGILIKLMDDISEWKSTPNELLNELDRRADDRTRRQQAWPKSARTLTSQLKRLDTALRTIGIAVLFTRSHGSRYVTLHHIRE
ncbi:MAG: hypothetical protein ACU4EQ_07275 [Candidatus Nitrosoglobus sp.]